MKLRELYGDAIENEHSAWIDMFNSIADTFEISTEELNNIRKYRKIFVLIERWAYFDRERRKVIDEKYRDEPGLFYKGEE